MIRFVIIFFCLCFSFQQVFADVIPTSAKSIKYFGFGVLDMKKSFYIYSKPDKKSSVLKYIDYKKAAEYSPVISEKSDIEKTLIAYVPEASVHLATVSSDREDGWFEIYYDQTTGARGWVKPENKQDFKTWRNLFYLYGKKNGLYLFRDVSKDKRKLYCKESLQSKSIETLTYPKHITFSIIRGNWMLVSVLDVGHKTKIGWFKWREDDGTLLVFPYFK